MFRRLSPHALPGRWGSTVTHHIVPLPRRLKKEFQEAVSASYLVMFTGSSHLPCQGRCILFRETNIISCGKSCDSQPTYLSKYPLRRGHLRSSWVGCLIGYSKVLTLMSSDVKHHHKSTWNMSCSHVSSRESRTALAEDLTRGLLPLGPSYGCPLAGPKPTKCRDERLLLLPIHSPSPPFRSARRAPLVASPAHHLCWSLQARDARLAAVGKR